MIARIKKLARRNKGMEALQAVILLGAGFVVTWGLMAVWGDLKDAVKTQSGSTINGDQTPSKVK